MHDYQRDFIELTLQREVLRFGEFILKSGRQSPYFFNMGRLDSGDALAQLGRAYADALVNSGVPIDMLFGPAYKGIALAALLADLIERHRHARLLVLSVACSNLAAMRLYRRAGPDWSAAPGFKRAWSF